MANNKTVTFSLFLVLGYFISLQSIRSEGKPVVQQCLAPEVAEGHTGMMAFFIRHDVNFTRDKFFANLVRSQVPDWDILHCEQQNKSLIVDCKVNSDLYECEGLQQHRLTVFIPNITPHFEDTYVLQAYVNGKPEPPDFCSLKVRRQQEPDKEQSKIEAAETPWEAATAVGVALTIVIICIVIFFMRHRIFGSANREGDQSQLLLLPYKGKAHLKMRWYFENLSKEAERKLLQFKRNGNGSFLVRVSFTNTEQHVLVVCFGGELNYLTLVPKKIGYKCPSTGHVFQTLCGVVDYYKVHPIKVNDKEWGKLSKPFEKEPEADWYFGELATEHEEKIFQSNSEVGSFLIAVSTNDPEAYYLMVKTDDGICHFAIFPYDRGFQVIDTGYTCKLLPEIVAYYEKHNIKGHTLKKKCSKAPFEGWYFENISREDLEIFSKSKRTRPGSFLITNDANSRNTYLLRVYFDGQIRRFPVTREGIGFRFHSEGTFFYSWYELVDFYRAHELKIGDNGSVKLHKPFRKEPEEDWYFGPLRRDDERKIFSNCSAGAFLIRDSITDPSNYTLSMFYDGQSRQHVIISEDTGFKMINTDRTFPTLGELVQHYQDNEIELVDGTNCGTLSDTFKKDPPSEWCFETFTTADEEMLSSKKQAQPGSFLITGHSSSPNTYTLAVYLGGDIQRFKVKQERNGFRFLTTGAFFYTWYELVDHYRNNDIKVNDRVLGRLVKPFRKDFSEEWYFGPFSREDEGKLLQTPSTGRNGHGSFLIRDGISDPDNYVLAVNFRGKLKHFSIIPKDDGGLTLYETGEDFPTMTALVEHYKKNEIKVDDNTYGKLVMPFHKVCGKN